MIRSFVRALIGPSKMFYSKYIQLTQQQSKESLLLNKKIKSILSKEDLLFLLKSEEDKIQKYGKTMVLEFLNEYFIPSLIINQDFVNGISLFLKNMHDLNAYEKILKLNILTKMKKNSYNNVDYYQKQIEKIIDELVLDLRSDKIDHIDSFNMIFVFHLFEETRLLRQIFLNLDNQVHKIKEDSNIGKIWSMTINQIVHIQWSQLYQYKNLLSYTSNKIISKGLTNDQNLISLFKKISSLKLYKVGPMEMPKSLHHILQLLQPNLNKLSSQNLFQLFSAFEDLPLQYARPFYEKLKQKILDKKSLNPKIHYYLPFNRLSQQQIEEIFIRLESHKDQLARTSIYSFEEHKKKKYVFNKVMMKYLESIITSKGNSDKSEFQLSMIVWTTKLFMEKGDTDRAEKGMKLFFSMFKVQFLSKFSLTNILNAIQILEKMKKTSQLKVCLAYFEQVKSQRTPKKRFKNNSLQMIKAIAYHIYTDSQIILKIVYSMIQELIEGTKTHKQFFIYSSILFCLINKVNKAETDIKLITEITKLILSKKDGLELLIDYYLLHYTHSIKATNQIIKIVLKNSKDTSTTFFILVKLMLGVPIRTLTTFRGSLETSLISYLKKLSIDKIDLSYYQIGIWNKFIGLINNFPALLQFSQKIFIKYLDYLSTIQMNQENINKNQVNKITEFVDHFHTLYSSDKMNVITRTKIVQKLITILTKMMKVEKGMNISIKYLELITKNKGILTIKEVQEQLAKNRIQKAISNSNQPENLSEVIFTLNELYSFGYIQLEQKTVKKYQNILHSAISSKKLNSYIVGKRITHNFGSITLNPSLFEKIKQFYSPIIRELYFSEQTNSYHILNTYCQYFDYTEDDEAFEDVLQKMCSGFLHPLQIVRIVSLMKKRGTTNNIIIKKIKEKVEKSFLYFQSEMKEILYFFQFQQFDTQKDKKFFDQMYQICDKQISKNMPKILKQNSSFLQSMYMLGKITLYMACCIKSQRVQSENFRLISQFLLKNQSQFMNKAKSHKAKLIDASIISYLKAKNNQETSITFLRQKSRAFELYAKKNSLKVKNHQTINGIHVAYSLAEGDRVVIIMNSKHYDRKNKQWNGLIKFMIEVAKACTGKNISVFDIYNEKLIDL